VVASGPAIDKTSSGCGREWCPTSKEGRPEHLRVISGIIKMIKIDKNIPIAFKRRTTLPKYPWGEMEVGDSFLVEGVSSSLISSATHYYGSTHNKKFKTRKVEGGVRVWRIE
jgi:hypothetical protein